MSEISSSSMLNLVKQADVVVQSVMALLAFASVISWALIFDKIVKFMILKSRSDRFEHIFENNMIENVYKKVLISKGHPMSSVFMGCIQEWRSNDINQIIENGAEKKSSLKERLYLASQIASRRSVAKLESGLSLLAIIGSSAPFIGLFGTVWGILNSFQGIAVSKNTSLEVVAPGIAEALLATAIGLFAAIPASFFYNIFLSKINEFNERLESFSMSLLNLLSHELES